MEDKLKKLRRFTTATFALWPFDPKKDSARLHTKLVILGLNPSGTTSFGTNFATFRGYGGKYDEWYKEGFAKAPFAGAFMTDLMSYINADSKAALDKWKNERGFRNKYMRVLQKQFDILGVKDSTIIVCIGKNTGNAFRPAFPNFKHVYSIGHPNSYRMVGKRKVFLSHLKEIERAVKKLQRTGK